MATLTQTEVSVVVTLDAVRDSSGGAILRLTGRSLDAEGHVVRRLVGLDITRLVTQAQRDGAANLLTAAEARLKTMWEIP